MNIRTYKKFIREATPGARFYLNAIDCSIPMIEYTREMIKAGKIKPDRDELNKMISPEYLGDFLNGERIAPQMIYEIM